MNSSRREVRIAVASPHPLDTARGNTTTVRRIGAILRGLGYAARECHGWDGEEAEALVSLHAEKGAEAVRSFRRAHPEAPVIVYFGGTDLYHDLLDPSPSAGECLRTADRLVLPQEASLRSVPEEHRSKTRVIPVSVEVDLPHPWPGRENGFFDVAVAGHLRAVKDPFLAVRAVHGRPEWKEVRVWQIGGALEEGFAGKAREWERREPRYRWLDVLPREEAVGWLCRAAVLVNSSVLEGGSNAIAEAMQVGTPVVASRVEGNVGLLGEEYDGYFPVGEVEELAENLEVLRGFREEWKNLQQQVCARRRLFSRERERSGWKELLAELL